MVDENADRARLPGQQPVPERDIEPLWPSDATDPAPAWGGSPSTLYPSLTAEVGRPPTSAWAPPPPDGDWPSLQAEPTVPTAPPEESAPNGPGVSNGYGYPGDASHGNTVGQAAAQPAEGGYAAQPAEGAGPDQFRSRPDGGEATPGGVPEQRVPGPRVGPSAPVDLDLPFTLDQPMTPGPAVPLGTGDSAGTSVATQTYPVDAGPVAPVETHSVPAPSTPGRVTGAETQSGPVPIAPAGAPVDVATPSGLGTPVVPVEGGATRESPWAHPPQRLSAGGDEAVGSAAVPGRTQDAPPAPKLG
ncbi:hypothetical protein E1193_30600, partial [Micromonospora sp. KC606]